MTCDDFFREIPAHIKHKAAWRYNQRHADRRKQTQLTYYESNKENIKAARRARYARQKAEKLAAAAAAAATTVAAAE